MLVERVKIIVLDLRNDIAEYLLIGEKPGGHNDVKDWRVLKQFKRLLAQ